MTQGSLLIGRDCTGQNKELPYWLINSRQKPGEQGWDLEKLSEMILKK